MKIEFSMLTLKYFKKVLITMQKYRMTFMNQSLTGKLNVGLCNWKFYIANATTKTMKHSESLLQKTS